MKLHLPSVLLTVGVLGVVALTSSQSPLLPTGFRIDYLPHPRDYVQFGGVNSYTVPNGKILTITAVGGRGTLEIVHVTVDGQDCLRVNTGSVVASSMLSVPSGFTVASGSVVQLLREGSQGTLPSPNTLAWGYLASQ